MTTPPLPALYRDQHLAAFDEPSGLAVHRGWAADRDVAVARAGATLGARVWTVHRLDRGTSGVLLFALSADVAAALCAAFAAGGVDKRYVALVRGAPPDVGLIDHPLPPDEDPRAPRVPARTAFTRLERLGRYSLVEAQPLTGRLHQVRRHLRHLGHPLVGDVTYGRGEHNRFFRARFALHRLFLHARQVALAHPITGAPLVIDAPLAPELAATLLALRAAGPELETP